jgi:putative nucleotidyltransferase with HDIG domain
VKIPFREEISVMQTFDIGEDTVSGFRNWFISYVKFFQSSDPIMNHSFAVKKEHSLRVCKEILNLGGLLGLHLEELCIAETAALFHDIGRFEQYRRFRTFADGRSENHAELGIKILRGDYVLDALERVPRDLIIKPILYHNRLSIPENETKPCLLFSRLLRDADKLDILNIVTEYYQRSGSERSAAIELELPDTPHVSESVLKNLRAGRLVSSEDLKSLNDFKLLQLGWVYDINFKPTFQIISDRGYLKAIRDVLPPSKDIDDVFSMITEYLETKIFKAE